MPAPAHGDTEAEPTGSEPPLSREIVEDREVIRDGEIETTVRHYEHPAEDRNADEQPEGEDDPALSEVDRAREEGAAARRAGHARRAVPGAYRTPEASHLARSWWAGWDSAEQRS